MISKLKPYLPLLIIFVYIILSAIKLSYPGFQYDELLFGNAALGNIDGTFVYKKILKILVMLMPYIGALKAYFYFPDFSRFLSFIHARSSADDSARRRIAVADL